jgi:hypothetical protein
MPSQSSDPPNDFALRQRALARWENEGGKALPADVPRAEGGEQTQIPEMTNAEIVALRVPKNSCLVPQWPSSARSGSGRRQGST